MESDLNRINYFGVNNLFVEEHFLRIFFALLQFSKARFKRNEFNFSTSLISETVGNFPGPAFL